MKKAIAIVLVLLMVLVMTACGGQGAVTEPEESGEVVEEVVEEDPAEEEPPAEEEAAPEEVQEAAEEESQSTGDAQISVTVPEGWEVLESAGMLHAYQKGTASFMMQTEPFPADSLEGVVEQSKEIMSSTFDNVQFVGDTEKITVGGVDASKIVFTSDFAGFAMKFEYVYFFVGGDVYAITFGDLDTTFDGNAADFQAILDGIVIN